LGIDKIGRNALTRLKSIDLLRMRLLIVRLVHIIIILEFM
jgi:hypothetical protein